MDGQRLYYGYKMTQYLLLTRTALFAGDTFRDVISGGCVGSVFTDITLGFLLFVTFSLYISS